MQARQTLVSAMQHARKQGTTKGDWAKGLDQHPYGAKTHAAQTDKYDEAKGCLPGERTAAHINR